MRGATVLVVFVHNLSYISIHAPHAGRDHLLTEYNAETGLFQSTRPMRGATAHELFGLGFVFGFQSTRPMRGATGPG